MYLNVFIITEGGKDIGFGHIVRCTALYEAFKEKNITPGFIINRKGGIESLLKNRSYMMFDWLNDQEKLFRKIANADIIVIDSYLADIRLLKRISSLARATVYFDDNKRLDYPPGIVINGCVDAEKLKFPQREGVKYLLGAKYTPLRKIFWNIPQKKITKKMKNVLITFGGNDTFRLTEKVLNYMVKQYPALNKDVIVVEGFKDFKRIERFKSGKVNFIFAPTAEKMKRIMFNADCAICAGGQTLYELARIGVPCIAIRVAQNQINNINGWKKRNFIEYAGEHTSEELLTRLAAAVTNIMPYEERCKRSTIGRQYVDGKGANRIVKALMH